MTSHHVAYLPFFYHTTQPVRGRKLAARLKDYSNRATASPRHHLPISMYESSKPMSQSPNTPHRHPPSPPISKSTLSLTNHPSPMRAVTRHLPPVQPIVFYIYLFFFSSSTSSPLAKCYPIPPSLSKQGNPIQIKFRSVQESYFLNTFYNGREIKDEVTLLTVLFMPSYLKGKFLV